MKSNAMNTFGNLIAEYHIHLFLLIAATLLSVSSTTSPDLSDSLALDLNIDTSQDIVKEIAILEETPEVVEDREVGDVISSTIPSQEVKASGFDISSLGGGEQLPLTGECEDGPVVTFVSVYPDPTNGIIYIEALIEDDACPIAHGEYYIDECGVPGTGAGIYPMDDGSYDLDNLIEFVYEGPVDLESIPDGRHFVYVRGMNSEELWGDCAWDSFDVDIIAPENPQDVVLPYWVCTAADISAKMCDSESLINRSEYFIDDFNIPNGWGYPMDLGNNFMWNNFFCAYANATINATEQELEEGGHAFKLHAEDAAGNWGKINTQFPLFFMIDTVPPTTDKNVSEPKVACEYGGDECWFVTQDTVITFDANDYIPADGNYSNNEMIYYRIRWKYDYADDWGTWSAWNLYTTPFQFNEDSIHQIEYYSIDSCTNEEEHMFEIDIVDTQAPVSYKELGEPNAPCGPGDDCDYYTNQSTTISLFCDDAEPHPSDDVRIYYHWKLDEGQFNEWREYEAPFTYEEDSRHELEWYCVDALGNEEDTHVQVEKVDSEPPIVDKTVGEPKVACGPNSICDWYINQSTPISFNATDFGHAENEEISIYYKYCVFLNVIEGDGEEEGGDCTEWMLYEEPFTYAEDSWHLLRYYAVDYVGNVGPMYFEYDIVDSQPPVTEKEVGEPKHACEEGEYCDWYMTTETEITLDCSDPQPHPVGREETYYRYNVNDGGFTEWMLYEEPFTYPTDSNHTLEYYCIDALGNEEEHQFEVDIVDTVGPTVEKSVGEPKHACEPEEECDWYISQYTPITFNATDPDPHPVDHSIVYYRYNVNGGEWTEWMAYEGPFSFEEDSIHTIEYYAVDALGNEGEHYFEVDVVDSEAPSTEKTVGDPKHACEPEEECDWYITQNTEISMECNDPEPHPVGHQEIYYRYQVNDQNWTEWTTYTDPFTFPEDSYHTLQYYCSDALGNQEEIQYEYDIVDTQAPNVTKIVGEPKVACEEGQDCDWYVTQETEIEINCIDEEPHPVDHVAIYSRMRWKEDFGDEWEEWSEWGMDENEQFSFYFQEDSVHEVEYYCEDSLGNKAGSFFEIDVVDSEAPSTEKTVGDPKHACEPEEECDWYITQNTEIELECEDPEPHPVDETELYYRYRVNEGEYGEWMTYEEPFTFPQDSRHELEYYCIDALGNEEEHQYEVDIVDTQAPQILKFMGEPSFNCEEELGRDDCHYFITQDTNITLECYDNGPHPVDHVLLSYRWRLDEGNWTEWEGAEEEPIVINFDEDSVHEIEFTCEDALGNTEGIFNEIDRVDSMPPTTTKHLSGDYTECTPEDDCDYYVCRNTDIGFTTLDGGAICHIDNATTYYRYRKNNGPWHGWYEYDAESNFSFHDKHQGVYEFEYYSEDLLGNYEMIQNETDYFDKEKPRAWVLNPTSGRWYHDGEVFSVYAPAYDEGNPVSGFNECTFYAIDIFFEELNGDELAYVMWMLNHGYEIYDLLDYLGDRYLMVPLGTVPYSDGVCDGTLQIPEDSGLTDKAYLVIDISDRSCNRLYAIAQDAENDPIVMDIDNEPPFVILTDTEGLDGPISTNDYFVAYLEATDPDSALLQCSGEIVQSECGEEEGYDPIFTENTVEAWLYPGENVHEEKNVTTNSTPITAIDVLFALDLTGSMGDELDEVKGSALDIMDAISLLVDDSMFGAASFMDYPHQYIDDEGSNCGYSATYGDPEEGDYSYMLDEAITGDTSAVSDAINDLNLGSGYDSPESYTRALYEAQFAGFRDTAKKIVIMFGDDVPHDCGFNGYSTGKDPGRDEIVDTEDDLDFEEVVGQLATNKLSVISVFSGEDPNAWQYMSDQTGGQYFDLNDSSQIPEVIVASIENETAVIDEVYVEIQPGYADWVTWTPFNYENVTGNQTLFFEFWFEVPEGTEPGDYIFWIRILGDGAILREQLITIHVLDECLEEPQHFNFAGEILTDHTCKVFGDVRVGLWDGSHTLWLYAMDMEYNRGNTSTTMMVDNTPPDKMIISPVYGETYGEVIPIALDVSDVSGVLADTVQYRIYEDINTLLGGTPIGNETTYDSDWRTIPLLEGDMFEGIYGEDFNALEEGLENGITYYLRSRACDILFEGDLPPDDDIPPHCTDPELEFIIDLQGPNGPTNVIISGDEVSWTPATDPSGIDYYKVFVNDGYVGMTEETSFDTGGVEGTWSVSAVDAVGNVGEKIVAQAPGTPPPANNQGSSGSSGSYSSGYVAQPPAENQEPVEVEEKERPASPTEVEEKNEWTVIPAEEVIEETVPTESSSGQELEMESDEETSSLTGLFAGRLFPWEYGLAVLGLIALAFLFVLGGKKKEKKAKKK